MDVYRQNSCSLHQFHPNFRYDEVTYRLLWMSRRLRNAAMLEQPIYLRIPTENEQPFFARHSCAEVVIGAVIKAQFSGWMRLHGFVVLPQALEIAATPLKMSVSAMVGYIESETIPLLSILINNANLIWSPHYLKVPLETQRALDA